MRQTTMVKVIRINRGDDYMTNEQAQKVLDELNEIRPENLEGNSKRLFEVKEELEMLNDIKEIAESKVTELNPIRISKNESVIK